MTPALKVLVRFRRKLDNEILNQKSVFHFNFMLDNYAKGNINDEDFALRWCVYCKRGEEIRAQ